MSSITQNAGGQIALGYNLSSSSVYPSVGVTGRDSCDALNNMTAAESVAIAGSAASSSSRYGDYNGIVTDPVDGSFWFTGQYNPSSNWGTNVTHFTLSNCPVTVAPSRAITAVDETSDILKTSLKIIPNPATYEVRIEFSTLEETENVQLQIVDMSGRLIWEHQQKASPGINAATVDAHPFANGYYLVKFTDGKNAATSKLIIQK